MAGDVHAFLGIPYAAAPVAERYLAAPEPHQGWEGVREATQFGPTAPQAVDASALFPQLLIPGDEYLNVAVYTPDPGAGGLPVFFWIHGGGGVFGSNADPTHGAARFARRGVVVVSINYRLGFEGFMPLRDAPHNRAVLDWLRALEWVQENADAFGGDPRKVTVGGYSAGAGASHVLLALPQARDLFQRVLCMSGVAENTVEIGYAEERAEEAAALMGVERTVAGFCSAPEEKRFEVQGTTSPIVAPATDAMGLFRENTKTRHWLGAAVDGDVVPVHPMQALRDGIGSDKALMIGCTVGEMDALLGVLGNTIERDSAERALHEDMGLSPESAARWFGELEGRTPGQVLGAALTARWFRRSVLGVGEARSGASAPTFLYEFTWQPPTPLGAVHCVDIPFAFDSLETEAFADTLRLFVGAEPPQSLADDMSGAISRFVTDGDPGWPRYTPDTLSVMAFDTPSTVINNPMRDQLVRDLFGDLPYTRV